MPFEKWYQRRTSAITTNNNMTPAPFSNQKKEAKRVSSLPSKVTAPPQTNTAIYATSRRDFEDIVLSKLNENKCIILQGIGGIGKTSIAQELYKRVSTSATPLGNVDSIAWIPYESDLAASLKSVAAGAASSIKGKNYLYDWLSKHPNSFVIIDNVDSITPEEKVVFSQLLNYDSIHYLITGRLNDMDFINAKQLEVRPLSMDGCKKLFCFYYGENNIDDAILIDIINALERHTVTIELVAKIANELEMPLEKLKEELKEKGLDFSSSPVSASSYPKILHENNLIEQISIIFSLSDCSREEKLLLSQFALVPRIKISTTEAINWFNCDRHVLKKLWQKGWLRKEGNNVYTMHTIIAVSTPDSFCPKTPAKIDP